MKCIRCNDIFDEETNGYDLCEGCEDDLLVDHLALFRDRLGYVDLSDNEDN